MRGPHNIWRLARTGATFERTGAMRVILDAMDAQTQAEIVRLFPELNEGQIPYGHAARRICTTAEARLFASIS